MVSKKEKAAAQLEQKQAERKELQQSIDQQDKQIADISSQLDQLNQQKHALFLKLKQAIAIEESVKRQNSLMANAHLMGMGVSAIQTGVRPPGPGSLMSPTASQHMGDASTPQPLSSPYPFASFPGAFQPFGAFPGAYPMSPAAVGAPGAARPSATPTNQQGTAGPRLSSGTQAPAPPPTTMDQGAAGTGPLNNARDGPGLDGTAGASNRPEQLQLRAHTGSLTALGLSTGPGLESEPGGLRRTSIAPGELVSSAKASEAEGSEEGEFVEEGEVGTVEAASYPAGASTGAAASAGSGGHKLPPHLQSHGGQAGSGSPRDRERDRDEGEREGERERERMGSRMGFGSGFGGGGAGGGGAGQGGQPHTGGRGHGFQHRGGPPGHTHGHRPMGMQQGMQHPRGGGMTGRGGPLGGWQQHRGGVQGGWMHR